jgi:hypothetical protein
MECLIHLKLGDGVSGGALPFSNRLTADSLQGAANFY